MNSLFNFFQKPSIKEIIPEVELVKLVFDQTKQITTLSTGSLVLLITFYDKLIKSCPKGVFLFAFALIFFVLCILSSTLMQIISVAVVSSKAKIGKEMGGEMVNKNDIYGVDGFVLLGIVFSFLSFTLGILCLCLFGIINLEGIVFGFFSFTLGILCLLCVSQLIYEIITSPTEPS